MEDACPSREPSVAYAYCTLDSHENLRARAYLKHNQVLTVYCNGQRIYENKGKPEDRLTESAFVLPLNKGRNHLLLKLVRTDADWNFAFMLDGVETRNHKQKYLIIN